MKGYYAMRLWNNIKENLIAFLYPTTARCSLCKRVLFLQKDPFCDNCKDKISFVDNKQCLSCGNPISDDSIKQVCINCTDKEIFFRDGISLFLYDDISKSIIYDFKYNNQPDVAYRCGELLSEKLRSADWFNAIDFIAYVPVSEKTFIERKYNQSAIIADAINKKCDIIIYNQLFNKKPDIKDQTTLTSQQRQENVRNAFILNDPNIVKQKNILLVDDVITSGATLNALSKLLIDAGADTIYFTTVATALLDKN